MYRSWYNSRRPQDWDLTRLGTAREWRKDRHTDTCTEKLVRWHEYSDGVTPGRPHSATSSCLLCAAHEEELASLCRWAISGYKLLRGGRCDCGFLHTSVNIHALTRGRLCHSSESNPETGKGSFVNFPRVWGIGPWLGYASTNSTHHSILHPPFAHSLNASLAPHNS